MKKMLFASTALVVASFASMSSAAEPITGTIGGYMQFGVIYGADRGDEIGILRDGEIFLGASGSSDNGLTFRVRVELEAFTTGDQIDENWAQVSGSFGALRVGSDDTASQAHERGVFYGAVNTGYFDSEYSTNFVTTGGDVPMIRYTTPNISGFSASVDYAPNSDADGQGGENFGDGLKTFGDEDGIEAAAGDRYSVGASYEGEFSGVGFGVGGGYIDGNDFDDGLWQVGADLSYAGFGVGVHYDSAGNGLGNGSDEGAIAVGVTYSTGPWGFGGGWSTALDGPDNNNWGVWANYALAPGVVAELGYEGNDGDDQDTIVAASMRFDF